MTSFGAGGVLSAVSDHHIIIIAFLTAPPSGITICHFLFWSHHLPDYCCLAALFLSFARVWLGAGALFPCYFSIGSIQRHRYIGYHSGALETFYFFNFLSPRVTGLLPRP